MLTHAIIIMAHQNYSQLRHLVEYFSRGCYVFIHIDRKSDISQEQIADLKSMDNVTDVYQKYTIHWGGFSMLKCEMFLLKRAINKCNANYIHLISGEDYPIKPLDTFLSTFEQAMGINFLSYIHLPHPKWQNNTYERFEYYYPFDFFHDRTKSRQAAEKWRDFQKKWHIRRSIPHYFDHLYGGSQWFSITRDAATLLLDYTRRHSSFYRRLRFTFAPEETYVHTVLLNLLPVGKVMNTNLRFIRWKYENGNAPANLGVEHFHLLAGATCLFARKFTYPLCRQLTDKIDKYLLQESHCDIGADGIWHYHGFAKYIFNEELLKCLYHFMKFTKAKTVLDVGCGCGHYVAALRRLGINAMGYDANPYAEELSKQLLPWGDEPCGTFDFTNDIEEYDTFDLVVCLGVLPYVPKTKRRRLVINLMKMSGKAILISWKKDSLDDPTETLLELKNSNYTLNEFASKYFKKESRDQQEYFLFESVNIINQNHENQAIF